jgi:hypothetical protein
LQGFVRRYRHADLLLQMKSRLAVLALLGALLVACALPATAGSRRPLVGGLSVESAGAFVNICGGGAGTLGVRVSAPYRGETLAPWVRVSVEYFSSQDGGWHPVGAGGDSGWFQAGGPGTSSDTGYTFPFLAPRPGYRLVMRGVAQVQWRGSDAGDGTLATTAPCEVSSGGTQPIQELTRTVTVRTVTRKRRTSRQRRKQSGVVRDHARNPQSRQRPNSGKVVDGPREQITARPVNGADQTGSDQPPVGHDGVTAPGANGSSGAGG